MSIRVRLALAYGTALLAGLLVFAVLSVLLFDRFETGQRDFELRQSAKSLRSAARWDGRRFVVNANDLTRFNSLKGADGLAIVADRQGAVVSFGRPIPAAAIDVVERSLGTETVTNADKAVRIAAEPLRIPGSGLAATVAWRDDDQDEVLDRNLVLAFTLAAPIVLGTALVGGFAVAGRGLKPLTDMSTTLRAMRPDRLETRVASPQTNDEISVLAESFNVMLQRLQGAFERERRLTADVSHELRAPLAVIRAAAEHALVRDREAEGLRLALKTIVFEADELECTISDMLALARSEEPPIAKSAPIDLAEVAFDVVQEMYPVARARDIRFAVDVPDETMVMADARGITRALRAVLHNAVSHARTLVTISATTDPKRARLTVADDGDGFSEAALNHAKDRLWKSDAARRRGSGAGLGLAIADAIVTGWGGSLSVANGDTGANVELAIPLASTSPPGGNRD
jgi:signal transduction histidine kinase